MCLNVGDLDVKFELGRNFFKEVRPNATSFSVLIHFEFQQLERVSFGEKKLEEMLYNTQDEDKRMEIIEERMEKISPKIQDNCLWISKSQSWCCQEETRS